MFCSCESADFAFAFTPKELRLIAQGCERSELPWVHSPRVPCTPTGFRHRHFPKAATPSG